MVQQETIRLSDVIKDARVQIAQTSDEYASAQDVPLEDVFMGNSASYEHLGVDVQYFDVRKSSEQVQYVAPPAEVLSQIPGQYLGFTMKVEYQGKTWLVSDLATREPIELGTPIPEDAQITSLSLVPLEAVQIDVNIKGELESSELMRRIAQRSKAARDELTNAPDAPKTYKDAVQKALLSYEGTQDLGEAFRGLIRDVARIGVTDLDFPVRDFFQQTVHTGEDMKLALHTINELYYDAQESRDNILTHHAGMKRPFATYAEKRKDSNTLLESMVTSVLEAGLKDFFARDPEEALYYGVEIQREALSFKKGENLLKDSFQFPLERVRDVAARWFEHERDREQIEGMLQLTSKMGESVLSDEIMLARLLKPMREELQKRI